MHSTVTDETGLERHERGSAATSLAARTDRAASHPEAAGFGESPSREPKPVSVLVFDFGRVITRDQDPDLARAMADTLGVGFEDFTRAYYAERGDYDRGHFRADGYWARVASALGVPLSKADIPVLADLDMRSWFTFDEDMTRFIASVRPSVSRILLLSNIPHEGAELIRSAGFDWTMHFDDYILSCEHRVMKPDTAIYDLCVTEAKVAAEHILFVDDIEANIEGARACGLNSHHYKGLPGLQAELASEYRLQGA